MRLLRERDERCRIIMVRSVVALDISALDAAVDDPIRRRGTLEGQGLHHSLACGCAIARIDIDVLAPEAVRAMVGITVAFDEGAAMLADEILYGAAEFLFLHGMAL
jgi:hypothetical protein